MNCQICGKPLTECEHVKAAFDYAASKSVMACMEIAFQQGKAERAEIDKGWRALDAARTRALVRLLTEAKAMLDADPSSVAAQAKAAAALYGAIAEAESTF